MTRRRREHDEWHEYKVAAAAIATLAFILGLSELTDYDPPETPVPPPLQAPDLADRHRAAHAVSRSAPRVAPAPPSASRGDAHKDASGGGEVAGKRTPAVVGQTLQCIRQAESGGDYRAFNGVDHYGAYQLAAAYSDTWAVRYGHPDVAHLTADQWPRAVQDDVARQLFADWPQAWVTYGGCS